MRGSVPTGFNEIFSTNVRDGFVRALSRACENACECYNEGFGSNEQTFGLETYHFSAYEITGLASASNLGLRIASRYPAFRFAVGKFSGGCYKVGRSAREDIWHSFPNNDNAAASLVHGPYLPGMEPDLTNADKVILAYMANHEDGLCSAYLCVPIREEDGRIVEWGMAEEIYKRGSELTAAVATFEKHPEEAPAAPVIRLRPRTAEERDDRGK